MALYSVYLPSSGQMTTQEIMGRAIFIKDRFSWGAFLIPPLWLGYKRTQPRSDWHDQPTYCHFCWN